MITPHGGLLVNSLVPCEKRQEAIAECLKLPQIVLTSREAADLLMIGNGSFSPLEGFMVQKDYISVLENMSLSNGVMWPLPVTLAITEEIASTLAKGMKLALVDESDKQIVGKITVKDIYAYDKEKEVMSAFGTKDVKHPGVSKTFAQKNIYVGGPVQVFTEGIYAKKYPEYAKPEETRAIFKEMGWKTIAAFQTRNPIHRSHEYLTKVAMEVCDGILIHPVVGALKEGDIPAEVRMECYRVLLDRYYPKNRTLLKVYPMEMRYAGPKEALLHAIIRQNFGCTHIIIGRDHAGVGKYYEPFEAQDIFDKLPFGSLQIQPLKFDLTFWCNTCGSIASTKTCSHETEEHVMISGTELRRMLSEGERPPAMITRPEVADILIKYYQSEQQI